MRDVENGDEKGEGRGDKKGKRGGWRGIISGRKRIRKREKNNKWEKMALNMKDKYDAWIYEILQCHEKYEKDAILAKGNEVGFSN